MIPEWNTLVKRELTRLHCVVFVLPIDRISKSLSQEISLMINFLVSCGMRTEHVLVVLNKVDFFRDDLIDNYEDKLKSFEGLPDEIKSAKVIRTCFLNKRVVVDEVAAVCEQRMVESTHALTDFLLDLNCPEPFLPKEAIANEELVQAERSRKIAEAEWTARIAESEAISRRLLEEEQARRQRANELARRQRVVPVPPPPVPEQPGRCIIS